MSRISHRRPPPSMVVAVLALVVAMGGTSYAALTVTGANVKNGSLTGRDVKNSTLATGDVKNRSLLARDFRAGELPAGERGPQGAQGVQGPKGDTGDFAAARLVSREGPSTSVPAGATEYATAPCAPGERAVGGGGANFNTPGVNLIQSYSEPFGSGETPIAWEVTYHNTTASARSVAAYVLCASP